MKQFDAYTATLKSLEYKPICDDCMASKMKYSQRQQANILSREARKSPKFSRLKAPCASCGGTKYLTFATGSMAKEILPTGKQTEHKVVMPKKIIAYNEETNPIFDLIEIGFEAIGSWKLADNELSLNLFKGQEFSPALYFFATEKDVLYVGKTAQTLKKRLYFYGKPASSQSTNIRLNALLKSRIKQGETITIFGYLHPQSVRIGRFELDYPAALENGIIRELKPIWNRR